MLVLKEEAVIPLQEHFHNEDHIDSPNANITNEPNMNSSEVMDAAPIKFTYAQIIRLEGIAIIVSSMSLTVEVVVEEELMDEQQVVISCLVVPDFGAATIVTMAIKCSTVPVGLWGFAEAIEVMFTAVGLNHKFIFAEANA